MSDEQTEQEQERDAAVIAEMRKAYAAFRRKSRRVEYPGAWQEHAAVEELEAAYREASLRTIDRELRTIDRLTAERDAARAEVERLREERDAYKTAAKRISDEKQATIDMLCAALNDESEVSK